MGVCTHLRYTWSAYNVSGPEVANPYLNSEFWLKSLGIRHIRDGAFEPNVNDEIRHIYDLYGIRDTLVFEPSPVKPGQPRAWDVPMLMDDLKYHATPQAVEAIEGPNESDNDKNFVYPLPPAGGHGFPSGTKEAVVDFCMGTAPQFRGTLRVRPTGEQLNLSCQPQKQRCDEGTAPAAYFT